MSRLVAVACFWDAPELYAAMGALRSAGCHPFAAEYFHSSVYPPLMVALGGVRLMVPEEECSRAGELIRRCRAGQGANGHSDAMRKAAREDGLLCPQCGADDYFRLKSWYSSLAFTLFFGIPLAFTTGRLLCRACGRKWQPREGAA